MIVQLQSALKYCRTLKFEDEPNYAYIKQLFRDIAITNFIEFDDNFDWSNNPLAMARLNSPVKHPEALLTEKRYFAQG